MADENFVVCFSVVKELTVLVLQWVKHWPADPAVPVRSPLAEAKTFSTVNGIPLHTPFSLSMSLCHRPDMTEIY